jgi:hypothetical protein
MTQIPENSSLHQAKAVSHQTVERRNPGAFFAAPDRWLADYNTTSLHSALGYRAPNVETEHLGHATPLLNGEQYMGQRRLDSGRRLTRGADRAPPSAPSRWR